MGRSEVSKSVVKWSEV